MIKQSPRGVVGLHCKAALPARADSRLRGLLGPGRRATSDAARFRRGLQTAGLQTAPRAGGEPLAVSPTWLLFSSFLKRISPEALRVDDGALLPSREQLDRVLRDSRAPPVRTGIEYFQFF